MFAIWDKNTTFVSSEDKALEAKSLGSYIVLVNSKTTDIHPYSVLSVSCRTTSVVWLMTSKLVKAGVIPSVPSVALTYSKAKV